MLKVAKKFGRAIHWGKNVHIHTRIYFRWCKKGNVLLLSVFVKNKGIQTVGDNLLLRPIFFSLPTLSASLTLTNWNFLKAQCKMQNEMFGKMWKFNKVLLLSNLISSLQIWKKRKIRCLKQVFSLRIWGGEGRGCVIRSVRFHGWLKFQSDTNTNNVSTDWVINSLFCLACWLLQVGWER